MISFQLQSEFLIQTKEQDDRAISNLALRSDGKSPPVAKRLGRDLDTRRCLLAFVFRPVHHPHYAPHHLNVKAMIRRNALDRVRVFYVIFKYGV
jgi:hypothetical protein